MITNITKSLFINALNSIKLTISNALKDLPSDFVFTQNYWRYKSNGSPRYQYDCIINFFNHCIKFKVSEDDLNFIVTHFRRDWVPKELHNYCNNEYDLNTSAIEGINSMRYTKFKESLNAILLTISKASDDLGENFIFNSRSQYCNYKQFRAPQYHCWYITDFLNRCIEFNVSDDKLKLIVPHFPKEWVPEELQKIS